MNVKSAYVNLYPMIDDDSLWKTVSKLIDKEKAFKTFKALAKEQVSATSSLFFHPDMVVLSKKTGISRRHLFRVINWLERDGWIFTKRKPRAPLLVSVNFMKLWQYISKSLFQNKATLTLLGTVVKFLDQKRRTLMNSYRDYGSFKEANKSIGIPQDSQKITRKKRKVAKNNKVTLQGVILSAKKRYNTAMMELKKKIKDEKKREYKENPDKVTAPEAWRELYLAVREFQPKTEMNPKIPNGKIGKLLTKFTDECIERGYSYKETKQLLRDVVKYWRDAVGGKTFSCLMVSKKGKPYHYNVTLSSNFSFDQFYLVRWDVIGKILTYKEEERCKPKVSSDERDEILRRAEERRRKMRERSMMEAQRWEARRKKLLEDFGFQD